MRSFLKSQSIDCMACMSMLWLLLTTLRDVSSLGGEFSILAACRSRLCAGKVALIRAVRSRCLSVRSRVQLGHAVAHKEVRGFNTLRSNYWIQSQNTGAIGRMLAGCVSGACGRVFFSDSAPLRADLIHSTLNLRLTDEVTQHGSAVWLRGIRFSKSAPHRIRYLARRPRPAAACCRLTLGGIGAN